MRILSIDFSIPYLLKDDDHPIGGWAVQLSIWLRALENAGHDAALLTWKGALAHVGSGQQIKLIETYDPAHGVRVAKYFYSYIPKILAAARAYRPDIMIQGVCGVHTAIMAFVAGQLGIPFVHRVVNDKDVDERCKIGLRSYEWLAYRGLGIEQLHFSVKMSISAKNWQRFFQASLFTSFIMPLS